jgi:NAD(P)-dependent dehydrogenase (short-subunit alcohol dehydrogenase family)
MSDSHDGVGDNEISSVLITGANAGIGRELARQFGAGQQFSRV